MRFHGIRAYIPKLAYNKEDKGKVGRTGMFMMALALFFIAVLFFTSVINADDSGADCFSFEDLSYETVTGNTAKLVFDNYHGDVIIPGSVKYCDKDYSVVYIDDNAFKNRGVTSVTVPDSVISIGSHAFYNCSYLKSVTIGRSVVSIGNEAFWGCKSLTSLTFPNSVTSIGDGAITKCELLTSLIIPDSVTSIGKYAFDGCIGLSTVTLSSNITSISDRLFALCESLTSIVIPSGVRTISISAFDGCTKLDLVNIPDSVTSISDFAFNDCSSMTSVTIGSGVISIGCSSFKDCTSLGSVTIPDSVTTIGNSAFQDCASLEFAIIGNSVTSIEDYAFENCISMASVSIGNSVTSIGHYAFYNCALLISVTIPDNVKFIGISAFEYCLMLDSVFIGNGVTTIYGFAFYDCKSLYSLRIGNSVTLIGDYAFYNCASLDTLILPDSVTFIGVSAFEECTGLTSVIIPESVTFIGQFAFFRCIFYDSDGKKIKDYFELPGYRYVGEVSLRLIRVHNVLFDENGGSDKVEGMDIKAGEEFALPEYAGTLAGHTFAGWSYSGKLYQAKEIVAKVSGDMKFTAMWAALQYKAVFMNGDEIHSSAMYSYGSVIIAPDTSPVRKSTAEYEYTFLEWKGFTKDMKITSDITFYAVYNEAPRYYDVKFISDDTLFECYSLKYGSIIDVPVHSPEKKQTAEYTYTFQGWDGFTKGMAVTEDHTFKAVFSETLRKYTISFVSDETVVKSDVLAYGTLITKPANDPVKESTAQSIYTFLEWDGFIKGMTVTEDHTFKAVFIKTLREYTINFVSEGKDFESKLLPYDAQIIEPSGYPAKDSDSIYSYVFTSWSGFTEGMTVTGDHTFIAIFDAIIRNIDIFSDKVVIDAKEVDYVETSLVIIDLIKFAGIDGKSTEIMMSNGTIVIDAISASELSEGEKEASFRDADRSLIPTEIRERIGDRPVYSIRLGDDYEFSGVLTISIKYELKDGENGDDLYIWSLKGDGTYDKIDCEYSDGCALFNTKYLSDFAVMVDGPSENGSDNTGLVIVSAIVVIVAVIFAASLMIRKR